MTVLKALKKMFAKGEEQQPAQVPPAAAPSSQPSADRSSAADSATRGSEESRPRKERSRTAKPRRETTAKVEVAPWKLEDFAVEPAEGKTRFHDFNLDPQVMHAIHDLGFPYCTPIQAQVLGYTLKG